MIPIIADLLKGGIQGILGGATDILKTVIKDPTKTMEAQVALEQLEINAKLTVEKLNVDIEQAYLKDKDSARQMQVEALKQTDTFSKRFLYYLATGVILLVFTFDILMFFVHYPQENRDMINQVCGILNATALVMVLSFFFGSSKGSEDKQVQLNKLMDK